MIKNHQMLESDMRTVDQYTVFHGISVGESVFVFCIFKVNILMCKLSLILVAIVGSQLLAFLRKS